ncbi:MAG: tryptophan synthase subunit alpha [Desulfatirhabdiaceae bacterium]
MNRIDAAFNQLRQLQKKALVGFVTAGDPTFSTSLEILTAMCRAGLDILELGVPFSDPTADGPVIQRSSQRAIKVGMTVGEVIRMASGIRKQRITIPIVLFSYYNPILAYGVERFYRDALDNGVDGLLIVDLPPEESDEMTKKWPGNDLAFIRLIAPTTSLARARTIVETASGFVYLVSKTGVTGSDGLAASPVAEQVSQLKQMTNLPICVGFGISTPDDVAAMSRIADGVVIGSAFERLIETHVDDPDLAMIMAKQVVEYKRAGSQN